MTNTAMLRIRLWARVYIRTLRSRCNVIDDHESLWQCLAAFGPSMTRRVGRRVTLPSPASALSSDQRRRALREAPTPFSATTTVDSCGVHNQSSRLLRTGRVCRPGGIAGVKKEANVVGSSLWGNCACRCSRTAYSLGTATAITSPRTTTSVRHPPHRVYWPRGDQTAESIHGRHERVA